MIKRASNLIKETVFASKLKLLEKFQGPTPDADTATVTISVAPLLNVLHGPASIYMDLSVIEAKKDEGRSKRMKS